MLVAIYWSLSQGGMLSMLTDEERLRDAIDRLGFWGPVTLIGLMVAAIVMSPIPSGPIALVAGAAYGPLWGTVYVVIGAETGALIAFWIARSLGYESCRLWPRACRLLDRLGRRRSQAWLMAIVFASRLVPFISFDVVSYAAGLTPLAFWRFALATLAGVVPISFLLVHFGEALVASDTERLLPLALLVGGITLAPIIGKFIWDWYRKRRGAAHASSKSGR
ncbi:MAG: TVP38/TMEM64 family protein [Pseudomonadota bacterium]|nr:TVP38/TMEM64 family protein [Pseudomonadota bacterium]